MRIRSLAIACVPLAVLALPAAAVPASAAEAPKFETVDVNEDGLVTFAEATDADDEWTEEAFSAADQDDDDALTEEEYDAGLKARGQ